MNKTAVVTGGSSGIGAATAALLAQQGYTVYELSRTYKPQPQVIHLTADITDLDSVQQAFAEIERQQGGISLLVNNAGMGISGATEFNTSTDVSRILDVNFLGTLRCIQTALPLLRKGESPHIVNVSSVAAVFPIPYQSMYSATKSAINALTFTLRNELSAQGIRVCAVMPGDVSTGFTASRAKNTAGQELYPHADMAVGRMEQDEKNGMTPKKVARVIFKAARAKRPRVLWVAGGKYRIFCLITKFLPASLCCWLVGKLYS